MINYTNSQIRSILNGLGYRSRLNSNDPNFPISQDESSLTDEATQKAIKKFQIDYDLVVDGVLGQETSEKMQDEMNALHTELNQVIGTNISLDQPFYEAITLNAVQQFQQQNSDGIASFPLREELYQTYETANQNAAEATQAKVAVAKA